MDAKEKFLDVSYTKIKKCIDGIDTTLSPDIYALSFYHFFEEDEGRFPMILISFNTISNYIENITKASSEGEAKWNYAFWLQEEVGLIGGMEDTLLAKWFKYTPYYYSDKESEKAMDDDDLFDIILEKDADFGSLFIEEIILLINKLFKEDLIKTKFGKNIPVMLHELEYYDRPISWTVRSNPDGLADEFLNWTNRLITLRPS